jgi:hypothetical protein
VIDGTVEDHQPGGVTGDDFGEDPGGRRYLLISAFVRYQTLKNLLPDVLLMLGGNPFLAALLNRGKAVFEGIHVAWRSALAFQS